MNWKEVVELVIKNHPKECQFHPNALELIMGGLSKPKFLKCEPSMEQMLDEIAHTIKEYEIYCPHEGIDRRKEFGHEPT
jgi:hypothetical protein